MQGEQLFFECYVIEVINFVLGFGITLTLAALALVTTSKKAYRMKVILAEQQLTRSLETYST